MSSFQDLMELFASGEDWELWENIKSIFEEWDHKDDLNKALRYAREELEEWEADFFEEDRLPSLKKIPQYWPLVRALSLKIKTKSLPKKLSKLPLQYIENLDISGGKSLESLDDLPTLDSMKEFRIAACPKIIEISSFSQQPSLEQLEVTYFDSLRVFSGLSDLPSLMRMDISHCSHLEELALAFELPSLQGLSLVRLDSLRKLIGFSDLPTLEWIAFDRCPHLEEISVLSNVSTLESLRLSNLISLRFSDVFPVLPSLKELTIEGCPKLQNVSFLSKLPNLTELELIDLEHLDSLEGLPPLPFVKELVLQDCPGLEDISSLSKFPNLSKLVVKRCEHILDFSVLKELKHLKELELESFELKHLDMLSGSSMLESITLSGCFGCEDFSILGKLHNLKELRLLPMMGLASFQVFEELTSLELLELSHGQGHVFEDLSALSNCKNLKHLSLVNVAVESLVGLEASSLLESVTIKRNRYLNDINSLEGKERLTSLHLQKCEELENVSVLAGLERLELLTLFACPKVGLKPEYGSLESREEVQAFQEELATIYCSQGNSFALENLRDWKKLPQKKRDKIFEQPETFEKIEHFVVSPSSIRHIKDKRQKALVKKAELSTELKNAEDITLEFFQLPSGELAGIKVRADMGFTNFEENGDWRVINEYTIDHDGSEVYYNSSWE